MKFWLNSRLVSRDFAAVSVLDQGFTLGFGVFETLQTVHVAGVGVRPFAMDRHVHRLLRSAQQMGLPNPDGKEIRSALLAVCEANAGELICGGRLRVTWTAGEGPWAPPSARDHPTLVVFAAPLETRSESSTLAISPWPRNERSPIVGVKSTSHGENGRSLAHAQVLGADEALLVNLLGAVCEGAGSNIFWSTGGQLVTPALSTGCLSGVTRGLVLECADEAGITTAQGAVQISELALADEVFLTSSTRDVQQVDRILNTNGTILWENKSSSSLTRTIANTFQDRRRAEWNPIPGRSGLTAEDASDPVVDVKS